MSDAVFPTLPGVKWNVKRTPIWKTLSEESVSGKEASVALMTYPLRCYTLSYELLRAGALAELEQLEGFFNARRGRHDTFLYSDPDDNSVTEQAIGSGNGVSVSFPLVRTRGGFTEPVQSVQGFPTITCQNWMGWQGTQTLYSVVRSNLVRRSEQLSNGVWTPDLTTVVADAINAPDGTLSADKLVEAASSGVHTIASDYFLAEVGSAFTFSIFAKAGERTTCTLEATASRFGAASAQFDLSAGTVIATGAGATGAFITSMGDGWYRCGYTAIATAGGVAQAIFTLQTGSYLGNGTSGLYPWGLQVEKSPVATSYMKSVATYADVTDFTVSAIGIATLSIAPSSGAAMTWSGAYYWRCKFLQDIAEFDQFLKNLWQLGRLEFRTFKQ